MIVADTREPPAYRKLASIVKELEQADYHIVGEQKKYALERKNIYDLAASVKDSRIWGQMAKLIQLRDLGYIVALVIEGKMETILKVKKQWGRQNGKWVFKGQWADLDPKVWLGVQIGIAGWGVPIIYVKNKAEFEELLQKMDKKVGEQRQLYKPNIVVAKSRTIKEEREDMMRMIDGIGIKTAHTLIEAFQSPRLIWEALDKKDLAILNILKSKSAHTKEVLG